MVSRLLVLVLALAVGSVNAANDLCKVSSAYTPDASSTAAGCAGNGASYCTGAGGDFWKCSALVTMYSPGPADSTYSADISTCGDTAFDGLAGAKTEKANTQAIGSICCSDKESVCGKTGGGSVRGQSCKRLPSRRPPARLITLAPVHHPWT